MWDVGLFLLTHIIYFTVNKRILSLSYYSAADTDYVYKITICQKGTDKRAIQQHGKKWKGSEWKAVGTYDGAHVTGGSK